MKKYLLSFALLLLLIMQAKAQFILAGQHGAKDYYAIPDITVQPPGHCEDDAGDTASYLIDMNGDGIMDFELTRFCHYELSYQIYMNTIQSFNNNEVSFEFDTTCAGPMALAFNDSDTINNNTIFIVPGLLNISSSATFYPNFFCYANIIHSDTGNGYLGVRVFLGQDTLYGWIKISDYYNNSLTIISYACNLGVTGINENQNNLSIKLSPNPASNELIIHPVRWSSNGVNTSSFKNEATTVSIMNVLGQETSPPAPLHLERGEASIDVHKLPSGIYFVHVVGEKESWLGKFVKE